MTLKLGGVFGEYRETARQSVATANIAEDLFEARLAAFSYRISPTPEAREAVESNVAEIEAAAAQIDGLFAAGDPAHEVIAQVTAQAAEYRDAFSRMSGLQAERETLVAEFTALGADLKSEASAAFDAAVEGNNVATVIDLARLKEALLFGATFAERFLLTNAEADLAASFEAIDAAEGYAASLPDQFTADLAIYRERLEAASQVIFARNAIRSGVLDVVGPEIQQATDELYEAIVGRQDVIGPQGASSVQTATWLVILFGTIAIIAGAVLARLISARIAGSVRAMSGTMGMIAKGDLSAEIIGADHQNELGDMARALQVFKSNAEGMARAEAEKDAAARKAAEAARAELTQALSRVVDAAAEGDFSVRMDETVADEGQREIAQGVNALLSSVDAGVAETQRVVSRLAEGDLSDRMRGEFKGAFATLKSDVNATMGRLSDLIAQISESADLMGSEVDRVSTGASSLAERAEAQASTIEETAATMEEMAATINTTADNASNTRRVAQSAADEARQGGSVVAGAVEAMDRIEDGSKKVSSLVSVIDEIAFQTNLLALNAAVEAARAGEAGKGFAVVAAEVRTLAQRSSDSARNIRETIDASSNEVEAGVALVRDAGVALERIVDGIGQLETTVDAIASASQEQAQGVSEITSAVSHLDQTTQQNAMLATESAGGAASIADRARALQTLVAFFRASQSETASRHAA